MGHVSASYFSQRINDIVQKSLPEGLDKILAECENGVFSRREDLSSPYPSSFAGQGVCPRLAETVGLPSEVVLHADNPVCGRIYPEFFRLKQA